jgi:hypothetical protein
MLVNRVETFSDDINPLNWLYRLTRAGRRSWLKKSVDFLAQYPFITSTLSSVLLRKSSKMARAGGVTLAVLQAILAQQARDRTPPGP